MRPVIVGKFRTIKELEHMSFTYKKDLRERVRFLIVDDEPFVYLDKLRNAKFNVTQVGDILDLHAVSEYQVIICDINGIGDAFSEDYGGAFVLNQIKTLYPYKQYAYYSGKSVYSKEMMSLLNNITSIAKDATIDQWIVYFDQFISNNTNPQIAWKQIRDLCILNDISTYSIAMLEDEYVRTIGKNPAALNQIDFNKYKIYDELQVLIKSIIANLLSALIISVL